VPETSTVPLPVTVIAPVFTQPLPSSVAFDAASDTGPALVQVPAKAALLLDASEIEPVLLHAVVAEPRVAVEASSVIEPGFAHEPPSQSVPLATPIEPEFTDPPPPSHTVPPVVPVITPEFVQDS